MASDGVLFENAFCQVPVCVPNRSAIFTGRYPTTLGTYTNACPPPLEEPMLPWYLAQAGYATGAFGKTHFSHNEQRGFMETDVSFQEYNAYLAKHGIESDFPNPPTPNQWRFCGYVGDSPIPTEHSFATWVTNNGIDFASRHKDEPFFLYLGYYGPHPPYQAPKPFAGRYAPEDLFLPPRLSEEQQAKQPSIMQNFSGLTEEQLRATLQQYYGLCTHIDEQIGRLQAHLEDLGLAEDTLIVFSADHGNHLGSWNRFGKTWTLHDSCMRVPLFMRWPGGLPQDKRVDGMVQSIDITPTILDMAGVAVPARMQGESRAPMAAGETQSGREAVFSSTWSKPVPGEPGKTHWGRMCIRTATHKLITWTTGERELYDLDQDPWEYDNVAGDTEYAEVENHLAADLLTWWLTSQDRVGHNRRHPTASKELIDERLNAPWL
jgi:arylsulfatase A-like enzyme